MKTAIAQAVLRRIVKQAGVMLPIAAGAGIIAAAEGTKKALEKSREYQAGFNPNHVPGGHA